MKKTVTGLSVFAGIYLGFLILMIGIICFWKNYPMKLEDYTKYALYMAVLDDEIMRKELGEDARFKGKLCFPAKMESLKYRYSLFLELNKGKKEDELRNEIYKMEKRLGKRK